MTTGKKPSRMAGRMSDIFYLRPIDPPMTPEVVLDSVKYAGGCFDLHRVDWMHSFLAVDGRRMLCWYRAPDAESARIALRELEADMSAVWPGRVVGGVEPDDERVSEIGLLAEMALDGASPRNDDELLGTLERAVSGSAELAFGFIANRADRAVFLLRGASAETVRAALGDAGFADASAWDCAVVTPPR